MFKCSNCKCQSQPREKENKVVVQSRKVVYDYKKDVVDDKGRFVEKDFQSIGSEIIKEASVCDSCFHQDKEV
jgi:hypothetical protein